MPVQARDIAHFLSCGCCNSTRQPFIMLRSRAKSMEHCRICKIISALIAPIGELAPSTALLILGLITHSITNTTHLSCALSIRV